MNINELNSTDTITAGDQFAVWVTANGDTRKVSLSVLKAAINDGDTVADDKVTAYAAPSATGFTVTLPDNGESAWLVLTPAAGYAAGTIVLPSVAQAVEKQEVLVNCTQSVTTLTINGNGATVTGAPTTLAANAFFRLRFEPVAKVWYRVG